MLQLSRQNDAGIIAVYDDIDSFSRPFIERAIDLAASGQSRVIVDLRPCSYFGAVGVSMLVRVKETYRDRLIVLVGPGTITERIFQITGTTQSLGVHVSDEVLGETTVRALLRMVPVSSGYRSGVVTTLSSRANRAAVSHRGELMSFALD